jgi:hypothetical protein
MAPQEHDDDPAVYNSGTRKREHSGDDDAKSDRDEQNLLTIFPAFNQLSLVLRDEKVMKFIKYVSAAAKSSRWDVCCEYEIGDIVETESSNEEGQDHLDR